MYYLLLGIVILIIIGIIIVACLITQNGETLHEIFCKEMYGIKFMEDRFPPVENRDQYWTDVSKGYKISKDKTLIISGLAYNLGLENSIRLMKRLDYLAKDFKEVKVVIYAADSKDGTVKYLKDEYKKCSHISELILPKYKIDIKGCSRIKKMGKLRNILVRECRKLSGDYVMFIDCDLLGPISRDGLVHSIRLIEEEDYGMLGANGLYNFTSINLNIGCFIGYIYYDCFALTLENGKTISTLTSPIVNRGEKVFKVRSAFGGACIYRKNIIDLFDYDEDDKICEHSSLNHKVWDKGYKLGINPSFILLSGQQGENTHK